MVDTRWSLPLSDDAELADTLSVFKYWCRSRADKLAKKNLNYACLSQALVEGGWFMAFVVRLSVIPT
jgi:hypothetical protein